MQPNTTDKLQKRAKRKYLAYPLLSHLLALDSPLRKSYETTLSCSSKIITKDGKIQSRYCKRTWCAVCSPIRTAIRINNYKDQLENMGDLQLTTLTMPNVSPNCIKQAINQFRQSFRQYRNTYKKRTKQVFRGVYNFEVTYNHITKLYHPHIHIIHECIEQYEKPLLKDDNGKILPQTYYNDIIRYWLNENAECKMIAQDTRYCYDLIEGFKYQSLSVFKIKINGKKQPFIPVVELDIIYRALAGVRCFQPFGIKKISEDKEEQQMDTLAAYNTGKADGVYHWSVHDWYLFADRNRQIKEDCLTGFVPKQKHILYYEKLQKNEHYKK